jgi:hypothetical protein
LGRRSAERQKSQEHFREEQQRILLDPAASHDDREFARRMLDLE